MGWLTTDIRGELWHNVANQFLSFHVLTLTLLGTGSDELITKIPNSQLSNIRISNRSRMKFSQVKQQLNFKHEDMGRIPNLCDEIRKEIAASCPKVVSDGSKTFSVKWVDFERTALKSLLIVG